MITEKMLEILILSKVLKDYDEKEEYRYFIDDNYSIKKINNRFLELGKEFLQPYALNKTEKSD
jgi:hypothetical protein